MALGNHAATALRARLCNLLDADSRDREKVEPHLVPMSEASMQMPVAVGNFTDFLTSSFHSERLSPTGKVPPSFKTMPIAYHSRASSVRVSGGAITRPRGQWLDNESIMRFGPTRALDYELEVGAFVGIGNELGRPIPIEDARTHIFGYCLLNDWSARDIQRAESVPLGPFLAKSLSTSISPWVITRRRCAPPPASAAAGRPPLPPLSRHAARTRGRRRRRAGLVAGAHARRAPGAEQITSTNFKHMYWTFAQMLTHHASNGCNLM